MLTIFTIPKGFNDHHITTIQENAIRSWIALGAEVFLIGNDPGVHEFAQKVNVRHFADVAVNEFGTPLLDSAFAIARKNASHEILCYSNADIILMPELMDALKHLPNEEFLAVGRRTDLDVSKRINFDIKEEIQTLREKAAREGSLHAPTGIDYFIFRKGSFSHIPDFAVGRVGWDIWMTSNARERKIPLIDMTKAVLAIHQNHDYPGFNKGAERKKNPEAQKNNSYIQNTPFTRGIAEATHQIMQKGFSKKNFLVSIFMRYLR